MTSFKVIYPIGEELGVVCQSVEDRNRPSLKKLLQEHGVDLGILNTFKPGFQKLTQEESDALRREIDETVKCLMQTGEETGEACSVPATLVVVCYDFLDTRKISFA